jgi:hypothetical protein
MNFAAFVLTLFATAPSVAGQAAKFAASWATGTVTLVDITEAGGIDGGVGAGELLATIKPPGNNKELLVGFSGVVNIVTTTEVVATNKGGKGTASAEAGVNVVVKYGPTGNSQNICSTGDIAAPGMVTFASRKQELSVEVDLDIVCADDAADPEGCQLTADDLEIDGFVSVGLKLDTTAAHHFNFVIPNLPVGNFDVVACYEGAGETSLTDGFDGDAQAMLAISSRMITVQQVKAVNGPVVDGSI